MRFILEMGQRQAERENERQGALRRGRLDSFQRRNPEGIKCLLISESFRTGGAAEDQRVSGPRRLQVSGRGRENRPRRDP